jgi:hypothetical protein
LETESSPKVQDNSLTKNFIFQSPIILGRKVYR